MNCPMKISVGLCTYRGEKFIREQLESICDQKRKVDEIIICDDCSNDHTLEICEDVLKKRDIFYRLIRNDQSLGVVKNFLKCYSLCTGDIIFSSDQDDIWHEEKVARMMDVFEAEMNVQLIASDAFLIDQNREVLGLSLRESLGFQTQGMQTSDMLLEMLRTFCITGATMAFRKEFMERYFYESKYWLHDGWLAMVAALKGQLIYLDVKLTFYRVHEGNAVGVGNVSLLKKYNKTKLWKWKKRKLYKQVIAIPYYYEDLAVERSGMYQEFLDVANKKKWNLPKDHLAMIQACIYFWNQRSQLARMNYQECQQMIHKFKTSNYYQTYSESVYFCYFDWYFWLIYHIRPRKKVGDFHA